MNTAARRRFDPYAELGVAKDAPGEAIKRAYRARAKQTHPDHGGTTEAFDKVKRAHLVLIDPRKRAKFDATGEVEETEPNIIDQAAWSLIGGIIIEVMQKEAEPTMLDLLGILTNSLQQHIANITGDMAKTRTALAKAGRMRGRFKRKKDAGENIIDRMVDSHINDLKRMIPRMEEAIAIRRRGLELIKDYSFDRDAPQMVVGMFLNTAAATSSSSTSW